MIESIKGEIKSIEKEKIRGLIVRSRCPWVKEGERNSQFFLKLEKQNFLNKKISQLRANINLITDPRDILQCEAKFFKQLYSQDTQKTDIDEIGKLKKKKN